MNVSLQPTAVSHEVRALLERLGVGAEHLAAAGLPARTPITGEVVAHVRSMDAAAAKAAILASIPPALRAARMPVVDALRQNV